MNGKELRDIPSLPRAVTIMKEVIEVAKMLAED